jgi:2-oxoisovalerate dehydrogenase E1 component alpha subunit
LEEKQMATVASFTIAHRRYLDAQGEVITELPPFARDPAQLIPYYRGMILMRTYDAKALALQRTGQIGTFASTLGQEAIEAGVGLSMKKEDVLLPSYRDNGAMMMRGVTMRELLVYWSGDERGSDFAATREDFPICITIAAQCAHGAGAAYAFKFRREPRVAVCMMGDGATSKGDFYEAMNVAGVMKLPLVFVVCNNHYAISVPRSAQSAAQTLAQKAIAGGIQGEQVDGNDVIAVAEAMQEALQRARSGEGATLIEAVTYRLSDHTTADDASRYRDKAELSARWQEEPILRLRNYLVAQKAWTKEQEERLLKETAAQVQQAADEYLRTPPPAAEGLFDHLYASLPAAYAAQRDEALAWGGRHE